jgi:hypothetical protein
MNQKVSGLNPAERAPEGFAKRNNCGEARQYETPYCNRGVTVGYTADDPNLARRIFRLN